MFVPLELIAVCAALLAGWSFVASIVCVAVVATK